MSSTRRVNGDPLLPARRGQARKVATTSYGIGTATYSPDMQYRYRLSRVWEPSGERCAFIMLNPSTATEAILDPTVTRCMNAAQRWGFGSAEVVNLFSYRATNPDLLRTVTDPVGVGNNRAILDACRHAKLVIVAWGVHGTYLNREDDVVTTLQQEGVMLHCLAVTKSGSPRHPLYLPSNATPVLWPSN
jgi:hypothetical protein